MGETIDNATTERAVSTEKSTTDSNHHEMHCPKCKNENTQSIALIIKAGTQNISTTTSSAGVGVSLSGGIGIGGSSSSTKGQAVTELATELGTKFVPNNSNVAGGMILAMLIASFVLSYYLVSLFPSLRDRGFILVAIPGIIIFITSLVWAFPRFLKPLIEKEKANNKRGLELWERWTTKGFFCHRCAHTFIPGSDEVYKAIE